MSVGLKSVTYSSMFTDNETCSKTVLFIVAAVIQHTFPPQHSPPSHLTSCIAVYILKLLPLYSCIYS
jgi:hypothetical protein